MGADKMPVRERERDVTKDPSASVVTTMRQRSLVLPPGLHLSGGL